MIRGIVRGVDCCMRYIGATREALRDHAACSIVNRGACRIAVTVTLSRSRLGAGVGCSKGGTTTREQKEKSYCNNTMEKFICKNIESFSM